MKKKLVAVDLFCGIGGLTHGLQKEGIQVIAGIDTDSTCKFAYEANNKAKFIEQDVSTITGRDLKKLYPKNSIRVLVGCAPCQTFSQHTLKNKNRVNDKRWKLLYQFLRLVRESKPDVISMENVPQIRNYKVFQDFVSGLEAEKYSVTFKTVNCPRYGIPQNRKRLVLLASKQNKIELIPETNQPLNYITVKDVIGHLPKIQDGEVHNVDKLHRSWRLSPINKERILQSKQGGTWLDWDDSLRLKCHKKKNGSTYRAVYGRMRWSKPASTITTQFYSYGTGRFGHPTQNRALSLREGALLQTFPENYKFFQNEDSISFTEIGRHIGNAVPVRLGEIIAKSIKKSMR
ncbi:DNA (cytosine-5-)-methyltransferase [Candidatus Woesearchaeota archaeon]|nr:DNA (cytosine-5-)-methyltransferase [Candidatus Woesearchaeota archaeon]